MRTINAFDNFSQAIANLTGYGTLELVQMSYLDFKRGGFENLVLYVVLHSVAPHLYQPSGSIFKLDFEEA